MQEDGKALRELVDSLFDKAKTGDVPAIKEIADRLDGKSSQQLIHSGDEDNPVRIQKIERVIVDSPATKDA